MKIITVIARFLLGLIFLVLGLNGFLHFIPMPPPFGIAGQFMGALFVCMRVGKANYARGGGFEILPRMESETSISRRPRRRFSAEEKGRIVGLYEESGLTRVEFCRREGIGLFNLQRWLGKRRRAAKARFVEVEARAIAEHGRYRFGFEGGAWLEVQGGFDEGEVRVLAGIVREAARC